MVVMRTIFLSIILLAAFNVAFAQSRPDSFTSYEEMEGKYIWVYDADLITEVKGDFIFKDETGKMFQAGTEDFESLNTRPVYVKELTKVDGKDCLRISLSGMNYFMYVSPKFNMIENIRSASYWMDKYAISKKLAYISSDSYLLKNRPELYQSGATVYYPVSWAKLQRPENYDDPVMLLLRVRNSELISFEAAELSFFAKDFVAYRPVQEEDETFSSTLPSVEVNMKEMDKNRVIKTEVYLNYSLKSELNRWNIDYGDKTNYVPFVPFQMNRSYCTGYLFDREIEVSTSDVYFSRSEDKEYLLERGSEGAQARKAVAEKYGKVLSKHFTDSVAKVRAEEERVRKEIIAYYRSNNLMFMDGGESCRFVEVYNCYAQEISRIECHCKFYMHFEEYDLDFVLEGPIKPLTIKKFTNLQGYMDDMRSIVVHFSDGTRKTITGEKNINLLHKGYHSETIPDPILAD